MRQAHHLAMVFVGLEYIVAYRAYVFGERHYEFLAYWVDWRVGYLRELLPEVVVQQLRLLREHRQRRVVAHRCRWFGTVHAHWHKGALNVFARKAESAQLAPVIGHGVFNLTPAFERVQLYAVCCKPLAVRQSRSKLFFQFAVVVYAPFLRVDKQNLARLQTPFGADVSGSKTYYAGLACHNHHAAFRYKVTAGAQTVAVEHSPCVPAVAEQQRRRTVPRLHKYGMVFVESLKVFAYGILVVERFGHKHCHGMRKAQSRHNEELQHIVERRAVAHSGLHDWTYGLYVAQRGVGKHTLPCFHPAPVSAYSIDFAVMGQHAERLRQAPRGERVGAETRMHYGQPARKVRLRKVAEVIAQLHGRQHTLVYYGLAR